MKKINLLKKIITLVSFCLCALVLFGFTVNTELRQEDIRFAKTSEVTHFFTHSLIAFPDIAFAKNNSMRYNFDIDCLTPKEFKSILDSLYNRGYALVDICSIFAIKNGKAYSTQFKFPKNKKPIVLSFDDINYYTKNQGLGLCDKLVVKDGAIYSYSANADNPYALDNECVPILEEFIKKYPDFSYCGARGVINLTGFDGVLGYRTNSASPNCNQEKNQAEKVIKALHDKNWRFACHSYGHYHMKKISDERFAKDTRKWKREVEPLVGETSLYVYPYGECELENNGKISTKQKSLMQEGFNVFFGVGGTPYTNYEPRAIDKADRRLFIDRLPLDGNNLRRLSNKYSEYFDCAKIYDERRPKKFI